MNIEITTPSRPLFGAHLATWGDHILRCGGRGASDTTQPRRGGGGRRRRRVGEPATTTRRNIGRAARRRINPRGQ
jgi:hypothetical protein